jgi:mRNA-degrading endonuclease toxin of MazEF toxin-antitoxin module
MKKISKSNQRREVLDKGELFWFDPLKETQVNHSPLAVVLSGKLHNQYAEHLIIVVASSKSVTEVRKFFEIACEVEGKTIKIITFVIHSINKDFFLKSAKYAGKLSEETIKAVNEKIKLILELDI